jgi:hypothetical protein
MFRETTPRRIVNSPDEAARAARPIVKAILGAFWQPWAALKRFRIYRASPPGDRETRVVSSVRAGVRPIHRPQPQVQSRPERDRLRPDRRRDPVYTLALHWAYLMSVSPSRSAQQRFCAGCANSPARQTRSTGITPARSPLAKCWPNGKLTFED